MSNKKIKLFESATIVVGNKTEIKIKEHNLGFYIEIDSDDKDLWLAIPLKSGGTHYMYWHSIIKNFQAQETEMGLSWAAVGKST